MIVFNNASILSSNQTTQYIGGYGTSSIETLSIQGYLFDFYSTSGISNVIISGLYALDNITKSSADAVVINDAMYGSGYVASFDVEPGNWTRTAKYNAQVKVLREGLSAGGYLASPVIKDWSTETSWSCNQEKTECPRGELRISTKITYDPAFRNLYTITSGRGLARELSSLNRNSGYYCGSAGAVGNPNSWRIYTSESSDSVNLSYVYEISYRTIDCADTGLSGFCSGLVDQNNIERFITSANYSASRSEDGSQNTSMSLRVPKTSGDLSSPGSSSSPGIPKKCLDKIIAESNGNLPFQTLGDFLASHGYSSDLGIQVGKGVGDDENYWTYEYSWLNQGAEEGVTGGATGSPEPDGNCFITKSWSTRVNDDASKNASVTFRGEIVDQEARKGDTICGNGYLEIAKQAAISLLTDPTAVGSEGGASPSPQNPAPACSDSGATGPTGPTVSNPSLAVKEVDSASFSANKKDGSFTASASAISYFPDLKDAGATGATGGASGATGASGFVEQTITRDEAPRDEYKYYTMSDGTIKKVKYPQQSIGIKTITTTRKYKTSNISNIEYPALPNGGNGTTSFTISKTLRKSSNSSSAEVVVYY